MHILNLEAVQRRFLKFLAFRLDGVYPTRGFSENLLCERFNFTTINDRSNAHLLLFLHKLIANKICCSMILEQLAFSVNVLHVRDPRIFITAIPRTNVLKHSPLHRMCQLANQMRHKIDIFHCSFKDIRNLFLYSA